jgi:uncharacterized membrane protein YbaN (DUF454 family)
MAGDAERTPDAPGRTALAGSLVRYGRMLLGVVCLVLGVAGLFLPFVQGILFLVVGLTLLSTESQVARRWLEWLRARVRSKDRA